LIKNKITKNCKKYLILISSYLTVIMDNIKWFFSIPIKCDIALIDSTFPMKLPYGFRNYEISGLLKTLPNSKSYTMYPMKPGQDAWFSHSYGMTKEIFHENMEGYLQHYPENKEKISLLSKSQKYKFKLAYSYFLSETYTLLPFYNKNKIPFIFVLYPGGAFGINNPSSDKMLQNIFKSKYFTGVITTQKITHEYLTENFNIDNNKIHYYFGGYPQFDKSIVLPKIKYKQDKKTFDVCFVAFKYSERGVDKGYDLFIESAKYLTNKYNDIRFHVVGNFDEKDIDVSDIKDKIIFYGTKRPDFLLQFYSEMDIRLSPCRPGKLFQGNFDGFPLGSEAMYCGTALFATDELNNNRGQISEDSFVLIKPDINDINTKLEYYYNNVNELYELSYRGQKESQKFDPLKLLETIKILLCQYI